MPDTRTIWIPLAALGVCGTVPLVAMLLRRKPNGNTIKKSQPPPVDDWYDLVIKVDDFMSVCNKGWSLDDRRVDIDNWKGIIVTVLGEFNKGKTWILNKLTNSHLPSGVNVRTEGLSFKRLKLARKELALLDTAGAGSPVRSVTDSQLQQKKAMEKFLRDVVFECADTFIYVMNDISAEEQIQLHSLALALDKSNKEERRILVIHNMRERATLEEMTEAKEKIVEMYVSSKNYCFSMEDVTNDITGETRTIEVLHGLKGSRLARFETHVFLGKEGTPAGELNDWVFSKLRQILNASGAREEYHIQEKVMDCFASTLPKYIEGPPIHLCLVPEDANPSPNKYIRVVPEERYLPLEARNLLRRLIRIGKLEKSIEQKETLAAPCLLRLLEIRPQLEEPIEQHLQFSNGKFDKSPNWSLANQHLEEWLKESQQTLEGSNCIPKNKSLDSDPTLWVERSEKEAFDVPYGGRMGVDDLEVGLYKLKPQPLPYFLSAEQTDADRPPYSVIETADSLWFFVELPGASDPKLSFRPLIQGGGFKFNVVAWKDIPIPQTEILRTHSDTRVLGSTSRPLQFSFTVPSVFEMPQSDSSGSFPPVGQFRNGVLAVRFRKLCEGDQPLSFT